MSSMSTDESQQNLILPDLDGQEVRESAPIPDKLYFKIGEVAEIIGVPPYVLRYWETEFEEIVPSKSRTQQRLYRKRDVERILKIKELLYREKFTIEGARKRLKELLKDERAEEKQKQQHLFGSQGEPNKKEEIAFLKSLKAELEELLRLANFQTPLS